MALNSVCTELIVENGVAVGVRLKDGQEYRAKYIIVGPGREGSEWLVAEGRRLGLTTTVNPVDIGVRVELPAEVMEPLTSVVYESKFIYYSRTFEDRVRTFCMCPHGEVVVENNDGVMTVNGHSHAHKKTANTNFALLVSKNFTEPFKEPITYGRYVAGLANLLGGGVYRPAFGRSADGAPVDSGTLAQRAGRTHPPGSDAGRFKFGPPLPAPSGDHGDARGVGYDCARGKLPEYAPLWG